MELYEYQKQVARLVRQHKNVILQAPTGAGKTFAALWPYLQNWAAESQSVPRKCIYAVPMRVLAHQFDEEYGRIVDEDMTFVNPPSIAKQTGAYPQDPEFRRDITFATIDQVLSSWLVAPYSLSARLGNLNAGAFVGSYLIFDEFHLFDPDSTLPVTLQMLKTLNGVSPFVLMTATFSKAMLEKLAGYLSAEAFLLTDEMLAEIPAQHKDRRFFLAEEPLTYKDEAGTTQAAESAVAAILRLHGEQGVDKPRTLVVCNQVERAQALYSALCRQKEHEVTVRLLHSRFLKEDRQATEALIRHEFGKDKSKQTIDSLILVATQVVEVGLDISCAVLHTELAPAAAVLQRAGRCARYQAETGHVYVYPLQEKGYAPYHGKIAQEQCDLTWEWLAGNQARHLTFADEQALINHAHTRSDKQILESVFETEFEWADEIRSAWRGEKDRWQTGSLIRDLQSVTVVVHANPDALRAAPFRVPGFSLHPGTLKSKFKQWRAENDARDPDYDEGYLEWLIQALIEDVDDTEGIQGNRPISYAFKEVKSEHELHAPLLAIHPALVGYSHDLGLTLYPGKHHESDVPQTAVPEAYRAYSYKLESYRRHIELVHQAFVKDSLPLFTAAAQRLEHAKGWRSGIITEMAHLTMTVHDIGKLSRGWQGWAHDWQRAIGRPFAASEAAAHTDNDPGNPAHRQLDRRMRGKRPNHAVESALAALPFLRALVADDLQRYQPLVQAAFTAVARHHAPFSSQLGSYELVPTFQQEIDATLELLPQSVQEACREVGAFAAIDAASLPLNFLENDLRVLLNMRDDTAVCCYMLLVRALRTADQTGTRLGSV